MRGHIHKRTHTTKAGKTTVRWYVVVDTGRDATGRRRQKWHGGFRTRKEAEVAQAQIVGSLHEGTYTEPSTLTLAGWISEQWLPTVEGQLKPSTFDSYHRNLDLHVLPALGSHRLRDLTPLLLTSLYRELLTSGRRTGPGGLSPKTVRYIHTIIHKALADAQTAGLLPTNPAERAQPPRPRASTNREVSFWEAHQLREFLELVEPHRLGAAWALCALTGLRRGEVLGLRWPDIDESNRRLHVRRALISVSYQLRFSSPKSHQSRVVDLDAGTIERLRAHRNRQDEERTEWGSSYHDQQLVFCKENGEPIHPQTFSQAFERIVARSPLPRIRLHDLRHTHASIALQAGVPVKVISERLGHESPAFTLRQYAHVIPGMQAEAAALVAEAVSSATGSETDAGPGV